MRIIIVGQNERALQCQDILGAQCVQLVKNIQDASIHSYDAVYIFSSNELKYQYARFALINKKHVLMDAPLWAKNMAQLDELEHLARTNNLVLHTNQRFRFIDELVSIQSKLIAKKLGAIQHCRLAYVANASFRHDGAMLDLMPHLLDLLGFWFGPAVTQNNFNVVHKDYTGGQAIIADFYGDFSVELAANYFGNNNALMIEVYGTRDSVQFNYVHELPLICLEELQYFQELCANPIANTSCSLEKWIFNELHRLANEQTLLA